MLPVHNQADHIAPIVAGHQAALAHLACRYELILAVNGSRDDSAAICRDLAARDPRVRAVQSEAGGWGLGVRLGLGEARGTLVGYTNSARTTPAQLASCLLQAILHPDSVVKATRLGRAGLRRLGSTLYNRECRLLHGIPCQDVNGTPKFFPRAFDRLLGLTRDDDLIDLEFLRACRLRGYPVLEVPIASGPRHGGESTTRLGSAAKLYRGAFRIWRDQGP